MRCEDFQEAISARIDGERPPIEADVVDAHVATCVTCTNFATRAERLARAVRVRPVDAVPDLSRAILAAAPTKVRTWPRFVLVWIGLTQLVLALPALAGSETGASTHLAREVGSWDIALAVALLVVAWQPRRANGLLPFAVALAGATALTSVLDIASGHAPVAGEAIHLVDVAGVVALWMAARSPLTVRTRAHRQGLRIA